MKNYPFIALVFFVAFFTGFCLKAQTGYELDIYTLPEFRQKNNMLHADTFSLEFRLYQHRGTPREKRISRLPLSDQIDFVLEEMIGGQRVAEPQYVPGSIAYIESEDGIRSDDITVSLLVDRSGSITAAEMRQIREAVEAFVDLLPDGSLFLSYFHNHFSPSYQITRENFQEAADTLLTRTPFHTDLYNATITKLLEFDSTAVIPNQRIDENYGYIRTNELARRGTRNNYLIVLTDGEDDSGVGYQFPNPKYHPLDPGMQVFTEYDVYDKIEKYREQVTVFTIGFGAESADFNPQILQNMANASNNPHGYLYVDPGAILELFQEELIETLGPDYLAKFTNPPGKTFSGEERRLTVTLKDPTSNIEASSIVYYGFASITNPYTVHGEADVSRTLIWGGLAGIIFIMLVLIIIQLIIPLINNKVFNLKYIKKYRPSRGELKRSCPFCNDPIIENQPVMAKCEHVVHLNCWRDNDYMCPEYGQNCTRGKQNYFDINDPFSRKNKLFYLNWVFFGLIGGFLAWIAFNLIKDLPVFNTLAASLTESLTHRDDPNRFNFIHKISPLLAIGISMGFFLSAFFAYVEEYRNINFLTFLKFVLRGVVGALIGFLAFLTGSAVLILIESPFTNYSHDWIPWLLFGSFIGISLSVKSTIDWLHGFLGGLFAIIFSFIVLYAFGQELGEYGYLVLVISFMLYGAGLGASIATVRSSAEQFFLKILNGPKEGLSIAVHKWLKSQGGLNEVYLGTSNACEIQMNWEKSGEVAEKHAKMFMNQEKKIPVLVSLEKGKTTLLDQRVEMNPGKEYHLMNGTSFTIGDTVFNYYEANRN